MARKGGQDRGIIFIPHDRGSVYGDRKTKFKGVKGDWYVRWYPEGRERREKVGRKAVARARYDKLRVEQREGRLLPKAVRQPVVSFDQVLEAYWLRCEREGAWVFSKGSRKKAKARMLEVFSGQRADEVTKEQLLDFRRHLCEEGELAPNTVNHFVVAIRAAYYLAAEQKFVKENPAACIEPLHGQERIRWLTDEEEARLLAAVPDWRDRALILFAIHTGLRQGELFDVQWANVSLEPEASYVKVVKRKERPDQRTKSGKGRVIRFNVDLREVMLRLRAERIRQAKERKEAGHELFSPYVFCAPWGGRLSPSNWARRVWYPALASARLKDADLHFHDLRHTFASRLVMAGRSLEEVRDLLGHHSITMTERYAHLAPERLAEAVEVLATGRVTRLLRCPDNEPLTEALCHSGHGFSHG